MFAFGFRILINQAVWFLKKFQIKKFYSNDLNQTIGWHWFFSISQATLDILIIYFWKFIKKMAVVTDEESQTCQWQVDAFLIRSSFHRRSSKLVHTSVSNNDADIRTSIAFPAGVAFARSTILSLWYPLHQCVSRKASSLVALRELVDWRLRLVWLRLFYSRTLRFPQAYRTVKFSHPGFHICCNL